MQIGKVAKRVGLTADAIRFYERNSLLPRPPRTEGGFRLYGEGDLETLAFIRRAQSLGFTLAEIRELLELRRRPARSCAPVCRRLKQKLERVQAKLADLQRLEGELRSALRACRREMRKRPARCPLLRRANPALPERVK